MTKETYNSLRKSYYYNFFPIKNDEDLPANPLGILHRALVEIRDLHPPPDINPLNPWKIRKTLSHYEAASGKINLDFNDAFDHVLRYWSLFMASQIAVWGHKVKLVLWDAKDERSFKKYEGFRVYFQMIASEHSHFVLGCEDVIKDRSLKAGDEVGLYWEPRQEFFCFKQFSSSSGH